MQESMGIDLKQDGRPVIGDLQDRIIGCLFGSALGDAIGLYTEFLSKAQAKCAYPDAKFSLLTPRGPTPFHHDSHRAKHVPGEWTDDTDQALCILLSFLHNQGKLDAKDFARRLKIWVDQGLRALDTLPLGLGLTVGSTVKHPEFDADPEGVARRFWESKAFHPAPNGSLMRTHPLGLMCLHQDLKTTFNTAAAYSVVTHADPRCLVACAIGTALVRGITMGSIWEEKHIDETIEEAVKWFEEWKLEQEAKDPSRKDHPGLDIGELGSHVKASSLEDLNLDEYQKIGYVYKTLGSGIFLLRSAIRTLKGDNYRLATQLSIFEELITGLTMCGGDADTNACFAGALLGSLLGYKALPVHWRDGLKHGKWLMEKSEATCQVLKHTDGGCLIDNDTAPDGGRGFLTAEQMDQRWKSHMEKMVGEKAENDARKQTQQRRKSSSWKNAFGFGSPKN